MGTELAHSAIASHSLQFCHATPYDLGYDSAASITLEDYLGLQSTMFLHCFVSSIQGFYRELLALVSLFGDCFVLRTHTLHKGGVMIRWLGRWGRCMGTSDHATSCFPCSVCCGRVLGLFVQ